MATREETERRQLYDARHSLADSDAARVVELEAVGTDYGNAGFTTLTQADLIADLLALRPGELLLDVGSGAGWPGVYLAKRSGCRVVVSDISAAGMAHPAGARSPTTWHSVLMRSPRPPGSCRFDPSSSTRSCTPMSCVECARSSPC